MGATQDGEVGARDAQEAAIVNGLDRGVQEGRRGAVGVEVDHIEAQIRFADALIPRRLCELK